MYNLIYLINNNYMKILNKLISFNKKYSLSLVSSSLSYYAILSMSSFSILIVGTLIYTNDVFKMFLINNIMQIIGETFQGLLSNAVNRITLSGVTVILAFSVVYSLSSIINRLTIFTDKLYVEYKERSYIRTRISSMIALLMLAVVWLLEIMVVLYSNYLFDVIFNINSLIFKRILIFILEILIIYITICVLYMYLPPKKMYFSNVSKISMYVTLLIYGLLSIFKITFQIISNKSYINAISFAISIIGFMLYTINYILLFGIIKNYQNNK